MDVISKVHSFIRHHPIYSGLALVLASRLLYVSLLPNAVEETWRDGLSYDNIARNLISGVGYWDTTGEWPGEPPYADPSAPTSRWLPGYPVFVAGVYLIFGQNPRAVYGVQAFLALVIAGLIHLTAKHMVGQQIAILAVFVYALDPLSLYLSGSFQTEQLFTALTVASVYFFLKAGGEGRSRIAFAVLFGLVGGLATLTRSVAGLMFAGLAVGGLLGWEHRFAKIPRYDRAFIIVIAFVVFLGTLAPWLARNYKLTGQYTLATLTWQALAMGNNDKGGPYITKEGLAAMPATFIYQGEAEREAMYKKFVSEWITENPGKFLWFCFWRAIAFWSPLPTFVTGATAVIAFTFNALLLVLAAAYGYASRNRSLIFFPLYMSFITFTLVYSISLVYTRYRLPLYPFLEILAAGGLLMIFERHSLYGKRMISGATKQKLT